MQPVHTCVSTAEQVPFGFGQGCFTTTHLRLRPAVEQLHGLVQQARVEHAVREVYAAALQRAVDLGARVDAVAQHLRRAVHAAQLLGHGVCVLGVGGKLGRLRLLGARQRSLRLLHLHLY